MKVRLLKPTRVLIDAGEIVEVSPAQANFMLSVKAAEYVSEKETPEKAKRTTRTKK